MAETEKDKEICIKPSLKKSRIDPALSPDMFESDTSSDSIKENMAGKSTTEKVTWCGSSLCTFTRLLPDTVSIPPIVLVPNHEVYVKLPLKNDETPQPYPNKYSDIWNSEYVRMPNSAESLYPIKLANGQKKVVQRWLVIQEAYQKEITSVQELRKAILHYNHRYEDKWKFEGLRKLLEEEFCEEERNYFFQRILPNIIKLVFDLPQIVTRPLILLTRKCTRSISLSQKQIACLLANAFLCTFPRRNAKGSQTEYASYPDINFNRLFLHKEQRALEKMRCIIHYFKEVTSRELTGMVTFSRQYVRYPDLPQFETSSSTLSRLHIDSEGLIEEAAGLLQMDFANKFIGGGVLGLGCVQEEIRFVICPELIVSRLFTEYLDKHEAMIVAGVEQFSRCRGYSSSFQWTGPHRDQTQRDPYSRRLCQVLALDAFRFSTNPARQYEATLILRELQKAYAGFKALDGSRGEKIAVATGNWGCGAFKGNPRLKGLIQIAAASVAGRDVAYFTFGDQTLRDELADLHRFLREENVTVGQLVMALCQYGVHRQVDGSNLVKYLYRTFSHYDSDTETEEREDKQVERCPSMKATSRSLAKETKDSKATTKLITDYFKPVSMSAWEPTKLGSIPGPSTGRKNKTMTTITEEKILEALSECDKLVKGKQPHSQPSVDGSKKRADEQNSDERVDDQFLREKERKVEDASPSTKAASSSTTSNSSSCDSQSSSYLFDCLNKIDKALA